MHDIVLFFLGADKWPEIKKSFLEAPGIARSIHP